LRTSHLEYMLAHAILAAGSQADVYRLAIDVVMCDEAHFLKNSGSQITQAVAGLANAQRRLLMSGTPIQNDLSGDGVKHVCRRIIKPVQLPVVQGQLRLHAAAAAVCVYRVPCCV
jgi:SNF2-related domain